MSKKHKELSFDEYRCLNSWKMTPVTQSFIQRMTEELVRWAKEDPAALKLDQWQVDNGICDETRDRWLEQYPLFKKAWQQAKKALGIRRENGAINNQYNASMIAPMMAHYDKNWKDMAEWRATLKGNVENKSERMIVVIPSYNEEETNKSTPSRVKKGGGIIRLC
jgi:hypothetical protein